MLYDCFSSRDPVHFVVFRGGIPAFPQSKYQTEAKQVPSLFPSSQLSWPHHLLRRCTARPLGGGHLGVMRPIKKCANGTIEMSTR